jgi:hypothetical protein
MATSLGSALAWSELLLVDDDSLDEAAPMAEEEEPEVLELEDGGWLQAEIVARSKMQTKPVRLRHRVRRFNHFSRSPAVIDMNVRYCKRS